jgi:N-ethylmaleimide reductase
MPHYPEIDATYKYLAEQLNQLGIAYMHVVDHSAMGAPTVPLEIKQTIRNTFKNTVILAGGHTLESAEAELKSGLADLEAFGRPFINNPDLAQRFAKHQPLSTNLDMSTFYSADEKGYTDYPAFQ